MGVQIPGREANAMVVHNSHESKLLTDWKDLAEVPLLVRGTRPV